MGWDAVLAAVERLRQDGWRVSLQVAPDGWPHVEGWESHPPALVMLEWGRELPGYKQGVHAKGRDFGEAMAQAETEAATRELGSLMSFVEAD